jgi:hypothetical protein
MSSRSERVEDDHVVDPVEELRPEAAVQLLSTRGASPLPPPGSSSLLEVVDVLRADVRGHDDDGVLEVDRAPLRIGQAPVVEDLQHDVEDFRVRLLDLVEQDDRVGPPPDGLGQLAALLVSDVARRGADQPRHGMRSMYSDMSMRTIAFSSSKRNSASARRARSCRRRSGP